MKSIKRDHYACITRQADTWNIDYLTVQQNFQIEEAVQMLEKIRGKYIMPTASLGRRDGLISAQVTTSSLSL